MIDLDETVIDTPERIAEIAEAVHVGNGASVYEYLQDLERGFALPIRRVREYSGFSAAELTDMLLAATVSEDEGVVLTAAVRERRRPRPGVRGGALVVMLAV